MNRKKIIIICTLLLSWFILTFLYIYQNKALTLISKSPNSIVVLNRPSGELLQGEKIVAEFTASKNYLGQVDMRFFNYNRINTDSVTFSIKEVGANNWYYQHTYKTDQFQPNQYFPFGFPVINDSFGKRYRIEVTSVDGRPEDAITLSSIQPVLTTSYQYPRKMILTNLQSLSNFIITKTGGKEHIGDFIINIGFYTNFVLLSLFLEYLLLTQLLKLRFVHISNYSILLSSAGILICGLVLLAVSAMLLYLRKTILSMDITILGFFVLLVGVLVTIFEAKIKKSTK